MLITYPYRNYLSACAAGFVGLEGRHARPGHSGSGGAWQGNGPTRNTPTHQAPLVWRVPEGPEGLAAVPAAVAMPDPFLQKSHAIQLGEISMMPESVAIPTL